MELRNITTFLMVAEQQNFTKSAEALGYSQAAVTVQIKQLEEELGVTLFDRFGWGTQLTSAGQAFMPYAQNLINASEDAKAFAQRSDEPEGAIRIGSTASIANAILPSMLVEFNRRYPKVYLSVLNNDFYTGLIEDLRQNELDFAFITGFRRNFPGITKAAERFTEIVFVCHSTHPLAYRQSVPFEELLSHRLITSDRTHGYTAAMEIELENRGYKMNPAMDFGSTAAIIKLLLSNEGISFLPLQLVEHHIKGGRLCVITTEEEWDLQTYNQLFYNSNKWINPAMRAFIDFIQEQVEREE